jgi:hypothetical protein
VWDATLPGFGVRVWPSGRRQYVLQYRDAAGASRRVVVGEHGPFTLDQARAAAAAMRGAALEARRDPTKADPATMRQRTRAGALAERAAPTVAELADVYLTECAAKLKPSTVAEYRRLLGVVPVKRGPDAGAERPGELRAALGRYKVADVTRAHVETLHRGMRSRPYQANRALALLSAFFTYAERHGHRPDGANPCRHVAPYAESKRERYLTDAEFAALGVALATAERTGLPAPPPHGPRRGVARRRPPRSIGRRRPRRTARVRPRRATP